MDGITFYEEYTDKRKKKISTQNCIAVFKENGIQHITQEGGTTTFYECLSALFTYPDSSVASGGVSLEYIADYCRRVSEKHARNTHPELFKRLDPQLVK